MAITFNCPTCGRFCGVPEHFVGRRARCTHCDCRFIVPAESGKPAQPVKIVAAAPPGGFFQAIIFDNIKAIFHTLSLPGVALCFAMAGFQYFVGNTDYSVMMPGFGLFLPLGWITQLITLGCTCYYLLDIIGTTYLEVDVLPDIEIGYGFAFFGDVLRSLYLVLVAVVLAFMPALAIGSMMESWHINNTCLKVLIFFASSWLLAIWMAMFGMELPAWSIYRIDLIVRTIVKTWKPYLLTAFITMVAFGCWVPSLWLFHASAELVSWKTALQLGGRMASVFLMLVSMRTIGLYCRYYASAAPWLWSLRQRE